ncbi:hypothetical protein [Alloactinosynnema sp. L-07]|nr:hypothetical protein [Alloactinosynnema sp. L-07]
MTRARHPGVGLQDPAHAVGYLLKERVGNLDELVGSLRRWRRAKW